MKVICILFKDTKHVITTTLEEIANDCGNIPTELEIMRVLKEMERDNEITIIPFHKNRWTSIVRWLLFRLYSIHTPQKKITTTADGAKDVP